MNVKKATIINTVYPYKIGEFYTLDFISKKRDRKTDYYYNSYDIKKADELIEFFREELSTLRATIFVNTNKKVHKHISMVTVVHFNPLVFVNDYELVNKILDKLSSKGLANSAGTYADPRSLSQVYECAHKQYGFKIKPETQKHFGDILDA